MDDQIWSPPPSAAADADAGAPSPSPFAPGATFTGRTPGRAPAIRAGILLGGALVLAVGVTAVLAASPGAPSSGAGAAPSTPASGQPSPDQHDGTRGNGKPGNGPRGFGPFMPGVLPPFGGPGEPNAGPGVGPGLGFGRGGPSSVFGFGGVSVTDVSGSDISLKTADGWTRTITVTADTKITKGDTAATIADVHVGDTVRFAEKRNSDGSYAITALSIVVPRVTGTVTAIGADTITITGPGGTASTIHTNGTTTYRLGTGTANRADVTVGATIVAVGDRGSDGSINATSVQIVLPRVAGTVTAVGQDSITVKRPDGTTLTIHVTGSTSITVAGVQGTAKLSDVTVGMVVAAQGVQRSDGSLDASAVRAGQPGKFRPAAPGPNRKPAPSGTPSTTTG